MLSSREVADRIQKIMMLVNDPIFAEFEHFQQAPSIFNAVGRTFTETWHSALLGWLLNPTSSHQLGSFPLERFVLLLHTQDTLSIEERELDILNLLSKADFSNAIAKPNEFDSGEVNVPDVGRFDVFIENINWNDNTQWEDIRLLIEVKVKAPISIPQCRKYLKHLDYRKQNNREFTIPVYLAPTEKLIGTPENLFGDNEWIAIDFQDVYDFIIEPCLQHPAISDFGKITLTEYIKTLKYRVGGTKPLITTQRERDIVSSLLEKHEIAIQALYEILSDLQSDYESPATSNSDRKTGEIIVQLGKNKFNGSSVSNLYEQILKFLVDSRVIGQIELPISTGPSRYLIATAPTHVQGQPFRIPIGYGGYFMEAHKSRDTALRDLVKLADKLDWEVHVIKM